MQGEFPDDDNGDVLRRMQKGSDDLAKPRNIDFTVVFPDQASAEQFSSHVQRLAYGSSVELTTSVPDFAWDVVVVNYMVPSHEGITRFETVLEAIAAEFGGRNDGWGCLRQS